MSTISGVGFIPRVQGRKEPLSLAMQSLWLTGRVLPMGARLWVRHEFQSQESKPVEVVYGFVLPRDATLRRFRIQGDGFSVASELRPTEQARKAYEEGIQAGSLSTLAREYGDGLINLSIGNLRPQEKVVVLLELIAGVELHDDGLRLRFPFTLAPSYHAQARALEVEPGRGDIELPQEEFDDLILPNFVKDAGSLHSAGFSLEVRMGDGVQEIASPSHTLKVETAESCTRVSLARESDVPDRDLVLDIRKKGTGTSVFSGMDRHGKGRFAVVVPSTEFGEKPNKSRRLVILLDRSGSMHGTPLARAKKAIEACLASLEESDLFGLVAFDNEVESFSNGLEEATKKNRQRAREFLDKIGARGGTELAKGVEAAAKLLNSGSRLSPADPESGDVFILTDGQVFSTEVILERARAAKARVHCLGIGSASQDRFLAQLATHTGGVSRFLTPRERVDLAALELFSAIGLPVAESVRASVTGVEGGRIVSEIPKFVFSGTPLLLNGETPSSGNAALHVEWNNHDTARQFDVALSLRADPISDTLKLFHGAKIISDYESRLNHSPQSGVAERREDKRIQEALVRLSEEYGLASSQMSLVAVVKRAGDLAGELPKVVVVPVGMNEDTGFTAIFRGDASAMPLAPAMAAPTMSLRSSFSALFSTHKLDRVGPVPPLPMAFEPKISREDVLVAVVGLLEPDGGLPGKTPALRITNSLAVLLFLLAEGNSATSGPLRKHVAKLMHFLEAQDLQNLGAAHEAIATRAGRAIKQQTIPKSDWLPYAEVFLNSGEIDQARFWRDLENAIQSAS